MSLILCDNLFFEHVFFPDVIDFTPTLTLTDIGKFLHFIRTHHDCDVVIAVDRVQFFT